jgi:hypothetical protein
VGGGGEDALSEHRVWNLRRGGHDDGEGRSLSLEGPWTKAFRSNVCDTQLPKCFRVLNNVIKYNGKTNPSVWLEDYRLACRAGGVDDDLFIIQFLPIYLADSTRVGLEHLPRNMIDNWEDLKEIFTSNFQGRYVRPRNPWDLKSC